MGNDFSEEDAKELARLTEIVEQPLKTALTLRAWYKWQLEFLRNSMVVAALFFLAKKSGSWFMYGIASVGGVALAGYCSTYKDVWKANARAFGKTARQRFWSVLLIFTVLESMAFGFTVVLYLAINKIVEVQGH
jgi:hypothetical protein